MTDIKRGVMTLTDEHDYEAKN
ncbi:hypothetical protein PENARI_c010G06023 [Penicillium arizonense]|uniref:Uncharacterized protein n=1 Tax=Penicillium arizonense TaxID=1835702 RepID=A0A1F5LHE8_PENAI|nr:hypothetical protein PENARI_c010G06023 [Penicillium arizonense]